MPRLCIADPEVGIDGEGVLGDSRAWLKALCERGIAEPDAAGNLALTAAGAAMRDRVLAARRQGLADLMARWEPDRHPDVLALLDRMVATLVRDLPAPGQFNGTPAGASNKSR